VSPGKRRLVLVDDDPAIRSLFRVKLGGIYDIRVFGSGSELRSALGSLDPDLILIDWLMPETDGLSLCREIRRIRRLDPVPIAFLTGVDPSPANIEQAYRAGAQSFISKTSSFEFIVIQIGTLADYHELLSRHFRNRVLMLSALRHDLGNLLTGVTAGVETLALHPAFRDRLLRRQAGDVLAAARALRTLFLDLREALADGGGESGPGRKAERLSDVFGDLAGYLEGWPRKTTFAFPESGAVGCLRRPLARALYYLARFFDNHLSEGLAVLVRAEPEGGGFRFSVRGRGHFREAWERAERGETADGAAVSTHDLFFAAYVGNALRRHGSAAVLREDGEETEASFHLDISAPA